MMKVVDLKIILVKILSGPNMDRFRDDRLEHKVIQLE